MNNRQSACSHPARKGHYAGFTRRCVRPRLPWLVKFAFSRFAIAVSLGIFFLGGEVSMASGQCVKSTRAIKISDGSAAPKSFDCTLGDGAKPQIRVEFNRLSDAVAGGLLHGSLSSELQLAFGTPRVIKNAVQTEAMSLFDRFGGDTSADNSEFMVNIAGGGEVKSDCFEADKCGKSTYRTLSYPGSANQSTIDIPLSGGDEEYIYKSLKWPPRYYFFYNNDDPDSNIQDLIIDRTMLWRPVQESDLLDYDKKVKDEEKRIGLSDASSPHDPSENDKDAVAAQAESEAMERAAVRKKNSYFSLVRYLMRDEWHDDFLTITGNLEPGCGSLSFQLHIRVLILDVAFVTNMSPGVVSLEGLLGNESTKPILRPLTQRTSNGTEVQMISITKETLNPGETLAIPLRMEFVPSGSLEESLGRGGRIDNEAAHRAYQRIQALPQGTIIRQKNDSESGEPPLQKTRESFGAPTVPSLNPYVYGPELNLRGLVLNGQRIEFDKPSRNYMQLSLRDESGSCPYLYVWDGQDWLWHGKVIHQANASDKKTTQKVSVAGLVSKFRISEEELEVSYIDRVMLEIERLDRKLIILGTTATSLAKTDENYHRIRAGETLEVDFKLPPKLHANDVRRSTIEITGYYQRYSSMETGRR